jgi:hypothetical protein
MMDGDELSFVCGEVWFRIWLAFAGDKIEGSYVSNAVLFLRFRDKIAQTHSCPDIPSSD